MAGTHVIMYKDATPSGESSITQHGITWTFDTTYTVGQYVTGDYWVLDEGSGVTVNSVDPAPAEQLIGGVTAKIHGSMINPRFNWDPYSTRQGFDSRGLDFREIGNSGIDDGFVYRITYPTTLTSGMSLLSSKSVTTTGSHTDIVGNSVGETHGYLDTVAVLTCVGSIPTATSFRPPYVATDKPVFESATMRTDLLTSYSVLTANLRYPVAVPTSSAQSANPCTVYAQYFQRPWMMFQTTSAGQRPTAPLSNMPNYHQVIDYVTADAATLLLCNYTDRNTLLIPFVQMGIDSYYCAKGPGTWTDLEGWAADVQKVAVQMAGLLLENAAMKALVYPFRTDRQPYYRADATSTNTSASVASDEFWVEHAGHWSKGAGNSVGWRDRPAAAGPNDEHEHVTPAEGFALGNVFNGLSWNKEETYRRITSSTYPGMALVGRSLAMMTDWNCPEFFEYVDRWMTENGAAEDVDIIAAGFDPATNAPPATSSPFVTAMWSAHR